MNSGESSQGKKRRKPGPKAVPLNPAVVIDPTEDELLGKSEKEKVRLLLEKNAYALTREAIVLALSEGDARTKGRAIFDLLDKLVPAAPKEADTQEKEMTIRVVQGPYAGSSSKHTVGTPPGAKRNN